MRKLALSDEILLTIEKPARYIGGEINAYQKEWNSVDVRACFCFPDVYDIATAHLGMQILYEQFNRRKDTFCDRVYSPWLDLDKIMREKNIPLFAVESQEPVKKFDLLLMTLQYEMCYTNILQILDLSKIPFKAVDRGESDPIVFGGGPCTYNPEPIADFFDVFYMGEGETQYDTVIDLYKECKKQGLSRVQILEKMAEIPGLYIPQFYTVTYHENGTLESFTPNNSHAPEKITKELVVDMSEEVVYPHKPIVTYIKGVQERAVLEIQRGCIRGCRFCQAGMVYRPVRERSLEFLEKTAVEMLESTGHEEISLSSLSTSDYTKLPELVDFLIQYCEEKKINISLPSLRIDAFSLDVMSKVQDVKKSSLTFAPEAGSQRLRDVINKGLTEEVILEGAGMAFDGGWNKVKLYFMLGLPTETHEDILQIPVLCDKIARRYYEIPKEVRNGKCQISASSSFFVPKPFTPFQWAPMCTPEEFISRACDVKRAFGEQLNSKSLKYHWHEADVTEMEGVFARGDRKLCDVILRAYEKGCMYDAWGEYFKNDVWLEVFQEFGISFDFYNYRERSTDELLPWDFIDVGVSKEFLKREWNQAKEEQVTPNCRMKCSGCGAMKFGGGVCFESKN